jgi:small glutamine-rich tetratricopeptide repeat-containing protein alpha
MRSNGFVSIFDFRDYPSLYHLCLHASVPFEAEADSPSSSSAAAHSQLQDHASAVSDARTALKIDPKFSKAYSRLGHALFSSGEFQEAVDAYTKGLELDPNVR